MSRILIYYVRTDEAAKELKFSKGNVGVDISSIEKLRLKPGERKLVHTGIKINMPETIYTGSYGVTYDGGSGDMTQTLFAKIEGRSGLALKHGIIPIGGIIDPSYVGPVNVILYNAGSLQFAVEKGMRIAQLIFYTCLGYYDADFYEWDDNKWHVNNTERGEDGFGSSGLY